MLCALLVRVFKVPSVGPSGINRQVFYFVNKLVVITNLSSIMSLRSDSINNKSYAN